MNGFMKLVGKERFNTNTKPGNRKKEMKRYIIGSTKADWLGCSNSLSSVPTRHTPPPSHLSYILSYYFFSIYYWEIRTELGYRSVRTFYILYWVTFLHSFFNFFFFLFLHFISYLCSIILQAYDNIKGKPIFSYKNGCGTLVSIPYLFLLHYYLLI